MIRRSRELITDDQQNDSWKMRLNFWTVPEHEFDQELVSKRRTFTGLLWFRADQLWCGDIPAAFP